MVATATLLTRSIQGESLSAATDRLINLAMKQGVIDLADGSFEVLEDTGSNMVITIGSGGAFDRAVIEGDSAGQGIFVAEHQNATQTLSVAASDPTNDRIDRVIVRTYDDTFDSSGNEYTDLEVITGTPDASPVAPAEPAGSFTLATILVQNGVTAITDADITDLRYEAPVRGTLVERVIFTSSGNFVKGDYPWLDHIVVDVQGGGGGGGGSAATTSTESAAGGGGGGGGFAQDWVEEAALSASETVTVGTGGAGGVAGADGAGGIASSFGAHAAANGGGGGKQLGAQSGVTFAGDTVAGGAATAGDLQIDGGAGESAYYFGSSTFGGRAGNGGDGVLGKGSRGGAGNAAGTAGGEYGGGGSGSRNGASQSAQNGGAGGDGIVIVDVYA